MFKKTLCTGAVLGSVTQRLLHEASRPGLAVPPIRETVPLAHPQAVTVADRSTR